MKNRFEDERYLLISVFWDSTQFIYLRDKVQKTESLGIPSKSLDVEFFWRRHIENKDYCLPCELLLYFEKKVMIAENSVLEWGITLERLEKFREFIEKNN